MKKFSIQPYGEGRYTSGIMGETLSSLGFTRCFYARGHIELALCKRGNILTVLVPL